MDDTTLPQENIIYNPKKKTNIVKNNLMFEYKAVSPFKLYCHLAGKLEIFLMIIGIITTIGTGCGEALKSTLVGDNLDLLIDFGVEWIYYLNDEELERVMDEVDKIIDKTNNKFVIYGSILFALNVISIFIWFYIGLRLLHKIKVNYFSLILKQEQAWFDNNNPYEFSSKVDIQLQGIEKSLGDNPRYIILFLIEVITGYIVGFRRSWKLTLIFSACSIPFVIGGNFLNVYSLKENKIDEIRRQEKAGGIAEELLYNIKTVTSFVNFDYEIKRYNDAFESTGIGGKIINPGIVVGIIMFSIYLGFSMTMFYIRNSLGKNNIETIGTIFTILLSIRGAILSFNFLIPSLISLKESCILASDYFYLYERVPQINILGKNIKPNKELIKGNIQFKNVKFAYPTDKNKKFILDGINLSIEAGKRVAIVGESGSGKSTTVNLIERLYEPTEGEIFLDGINIKDYNLEYLRGLIGFVKQDHFLFNKSIKNNIIFGREESLRELGDIDTILKKACTDVSIKDFIEKKVDKYDYNVGIRGNKLLPGHKQCISIARAIIGMPKIIILDEATSHLDSESERQVLQALDSLNKQNITMIIIGYTYNILKNVDIIYVLKDGKIIEKGKHEELISKNGYYARLIKLEYDKEILNEGDMSEKKRIMTMRNLTKKYTNVSKTLFKEIYLEDEDDIKFNVCNLFKLLKDKKLDLVIGTLSGLLHGAGIPSLSLLLGKISTIFTKKDEKKLKKDILKWSLILLLVALVWICIDYIKNMKVGSLKSTIISKSRNNLFKKYLELHMGFFDFESNNPLNLLSILSIETNYLGLFFDSIYTSIIGTLGVIITALILGFYYSWRLTLIIMCFFPFRIIFSLLAGKFKNGGKRKNKKIKIDATSFFSECVTNTKTIFSFNFQQGAVDIYKSILDQETNDYLINSFLLSLFTSGIYFISYASNSAAYKAGITFIRHRKIKFDTLIKVRSTLMSYIDGIYFRIRGFWDYSKVKLAYKSIYKILNTPSEINAFREQNINKKSVIDLKGKIEFKNVSFSYPTKPTKRILRNVSFIIPPGKKVAIVGSSESGKSTIIQLINRFYEVNSGELLIDDTNIKDYNLFELRKKIGFMNQEPVIFKRSLFDNILYGKLDSNKEEVFNAAQKACINEFLNDRYDYDDHLISEGQKQRIILSRLFLKNPDILLLENVTSSLDKENKNAILKSISEFQSGKTLIAVTHNLGNITDYDIILFMEKGRLLEQGTHKELLEKKGKYYNLYQKYKK